jgi:hypothetical protein
MADVEYWNSNDYPVSIPLPSGGTLTLYPPKPPRSFSHFIPERYVDESGEVWFDRFVGGGGLRKKRKSFSTASEDASKPLVPEPEAVEASPPPAEAEAAETPTAPVKARGDDPEYTAEQVTAMSVEELRSALKKRGLTPSRKTPEPQLRNLLAESLGLGQLSFT